MKKILLTSLFLFSCLWIFIQEKQSYPVKVDFFDVGQGDSAMITLPGDFQILIDGGPSEDVLDQLQNALPFYDRKIEMIILSHADADHLAGLLDVIQDYEIEHVYMPSWEHESQLYRSWLELVKEEGAKLTYITVQQSLALPQGRIDFFHPSVATSEFRDVNNESIVFKFSYGDISFLFTGDIEEPVEERLVFAYGEALAATVLKVPHHGSKTSSTVEFIEQVLPEIAVIQAGRDNKFGHPHKRVLDRYQRKSIQVFRTDLSKTISFKLDQQEILYDRGMSSLLEWIIGKNWERVYNLGT